MAHTTIDQWLRESLTRSVVLRANEAGNIEALAFSEVHRETQTLELNSASALDLLSVDVEIMAPSPTIPVNEIPEFDAEPETLRAEEVSSV